MLFSFYTSCYCSQLSLFDNRGITLIEKIDRTKYKSHIWIPHRPVIRIDPLVLTAKIRLVFNCSLERKGLSSINEAAYTGTNIMTDLFGLLQYFRTNSYVLLADIVKHSSILISI